MRTMDAENQLLGAWILPDGEIHWTDNIQSHRKVIDELGLECTLVKRQRKMKFTEDERAKHLNTDLSYVALRLGYMRITCFRNQFSLEYCGMPVTKRQVVAISEVYIKLSRKMFREAGILMDTFVLENALTGGNLKFRTFGCLVSTGFSRYDQVPGS